jgi:PAS domain S-box-containing protein
MKRRRGGSRGGAELRRSAEERLRRDPERAAPALAASELTHELQVHQVELELQNEELRRAQSAVEVARDLYLDLYDFAPVGYLTLDLAGRIVNANLTGAVMLGVDRAALLSRTFARFMSPKDGVQWAEHLRSVWAHGAAESCELLLQPEGRVPVPVQITSVAVPPREGTVAHVRCTLVDVSERRRAEEERERRMVELVVLNQRLEQTQLQLLQADKLAAIGQLAAGIAHEINNPLTYALANLFLLGGFVEELLAMQPAKSGEAPSSGGVATPAPRAAARDLEQIRRDLLQCLADSRDGLERVSHVVRDLRTFAHPDTARLQVADLHEVIEGSLRVVAGALGPSARVTREYGAEGLLLFCRPLQLGQAFMNILVNAAQANATGGSITIRTGRAGSEAWAEIADSGPGIASENLERIFEPFFTTKPIGVGTGLGLSIAQAIVRGHGGRIELKTKVGAGSTFRIVLPVRGEGSAALLEVVGPDRYVS